MEIGIGIDMGGTRIKIGLVGPEGKLIATTSIPASAHVNLSQRLDEIAIEVNNLLNEHRCTPMGVGIAYPGIVDAQRKKILSKYVKYPDARNIDLEDWARRKWDIAVAIENDARAALIGEWQFGAGRNCDDLVLITLGTGVGSAAMMEGRLIRGRHHLAGNLGGHMSINLHGSECNCGHTGCVESEASTWALQRIVQQSSDFKTSTLASEHTIDFNNVLTHAKNGDTLAIRVRENCLKAWSLAIVNLILAYDPQRVVIGGGIMKSKDLLIPYVEKMIAQDSWINDNSIELAIAEQVEYAGILGMYHLLTQLKKENTRS